MKSTNESPESTQIRAQAEAVAWIALLHSPERNAAIEAGLRRWIATDPAHAVAWEAATELWNDSANLSRQMAGWPSVPISTRRLTLGPFLVAGVACLAVAGIAFEYFARSTMTTDVGEQRTLSLDDGTRVELNTDTRLAAKYDRQARTVVLKSGEAYFQVAHEARPFVVVAGDRKVIAVGTEFTVRRDQPAGDAVTVTLIEGRVAVASVDAANVLHPAPATDVMMLSAGQRLQVRRHAKPSVDAPPIDKVTRWIRGQLIFDHTPLRDALAEFRRYCNIRISIASPEVAGMPVGGIFRIGDTNSFIQAVAKAYNLRIVAGDDGLVLQRAPDQVRPQAAVQKSL